MGYSRTFRHKYSTNQSIPATRLPVFFFVLLCCGTGACYFYLSVFGYPCLASPAPPHPGSGSGSRVPRPPPSGLGCVAHLSAPSLSAPSSWCRAAAVTAPSASLIQRYRPWVQRGGPIGGWRGGPQGIRPSSLQECMYWEKRPLTPKDGQVPCGQSLKHTLLLFTHEFPSPE